MKTRSLLSVSAALAAVGVCLLVLSCETESAGGGGSISISPREATLAIGESITLKARGGETYTWAIETESTNTVGRLSSNTGSTTVYTALATNEQDVIIRVSSSQTAIQPDTSSSVTSSTNVTATASTYTVSASAVIHQQR